MPLVGAELELLLYSWVVAMIRPAAAFLAAPMFGGSSVPLQLRILLSLAIGVAAAEQTGIRLPPEAVLSFSGVLLIAGEALIGLAIGFALQIGFAAARVAGEAIANAMGLGFAQMVDPTSGAPTNALSQLFYILALMMFLAIDGHLFLVAAIVESYVHFAPGDGWLPLAMVETMFGLGTTLFQVALTIAFPVGFATVLVQLIMGFVSRSTPSLNLFAVGLPVALYAGILLLSLALPIIADALTLAMEQSIDAAFYVAGGG